MSFTRLSLPLSAALVALAACTALPPHPVPSPAPAPAPIQTPMPLPTPAAVPDKAYEPLQPTRFSAVPGWGQDTLREVWPAFLLSCDVLVRRADWREPCSVARDVDGNEEKAVRLFFESFFVPHQVFSPDMGEQGLVTGYYEPLLRGARTRGGAFQTALHRAPEDMLTIDLSSVYPELRNMRLRGRVVGNKVVPYPDRAEMMKGNLLKGRELLWVDDPIEAFFLQVQGSGRVQLVDTKETVRLAYADQNGQPYRSIGRYLVEQGEMTLDQASAQSIKAWYAANPARRQELLNANPSYVFFREEKLSEPILGPKGALGVPLTPQRSIAVDPQFIPLGAPVFISTTEPNSNAPIQRLMMAQDTGGAIKGAVRADYFWGFGALAGEKAGKMKQRGMLWVMLPKRPAASGGGAP
jgi:membrane-bound lytic murein transglycosylase A